MTNAARWAGLFACVSFLFIVIPGYMETMNPLRMILYGLAGSLVIGFMGYKVGQIIDNPKGSGENDLPPILQDLLAPPQKQKKSSSASDVEEIQEVMTGEETFLEDVQTSDS